ncbi:hypothetical protein SAY86_026251 [Trapa natans]|uniref:Uncharacterized protein n=1 Tax=Trapa natans TaxID=22666 RepID=A0AAN7KE00_TRANT|nr:hypothetical protein SAY86_026251 [Trapa natans]
MAGELVAQRALFRGAITSIFPLRFEVIQQSAMMDGPSLSYMNMPAVVTTAIGQMNLKVHKRLEMGDFMHCSIYDFLFQAISKGRQGMGAQNIIRVSLCLHDILRLQICSSCLHKLNSVALAPYMFIWPISASG